MKSEDPELLFKGKFVQVEKKDHWEYVARPHGSGVVVILAITDDDEIILIEQRRVPVGRHVIELPAGLAGDIAGSEDEGLDVAAKRELREETGFEAATVEILTAGPSSAGLSTEFVTFFRARGLTQVGDGGGDGHEKIQVHLVPRAGLAEWIAEKVRGGCLVDYKIYAALYFA